MAQSKRAPKKGSGEGKAMSQPETAITKRNVWRKCAVCIRLCKCACMCVCVCVCVHACRHACMCMCRQRDRHGNKVVFIKDALSQLKELLTAGGRKRKHAKQCSAQCFNNNSYRTITRQVINNKKARQVRSRDSKFLNLFGPHTLKTIDLACINNYAQNK